MKFRDGIGTCIDCGVGIDKRAKRCKHCARMVRIKQGKEMNLDPEKQFRKGHGLLYNPNIPINHHIWYETNEGKSTNGGLWKVSREFHSQIHVVLRHNHWTDNRRYLAG